MREMGFKYKRVDDRHYYEQPRIIDQRRHYLCKMMQNRADNKPLVFLDETWANSHDGKDLAWVEDDTVTGGTLGGWRRLTGRGIILGAGGEMGWIPKTTLIFQSKKDTGDYHEELTGEHFEEWFSFLIVLLLWIMPHIIQGLKKRCLKKVGLSPKCMSGLCIIVLHLSQMALSHNSFQSYKTLLKGWAYKMAQDAGHEVVRLPVAYCTLNPIELALAQVKGHIKANTSQFTLDEVDRLAWESFEVVTHVSEFVIHVGGESSDESDDSTSEIDATQNSNSA